MSLSSRSFVNRSILLVAGLVSLGAACKRPGQTARPDLPPVILISIDTLRRDHLPLYGYRRNTAPNLQGFGREAVVFEENIAAATNTAPAHASMLSGLYPAGHGVLHNAYKIRDSVPVLAEILGDAGYETAAFVSGFTLNGDITGLDRGFDRYDDAGLRRGERRAEKTIQAAQRWLQAYADDDPFFLFVHLFDPHFPYRASHRHAKLFLPSGKTSFTFDEAADLDRMRSGKARPGELEEYVSRYDGEIHYADHWLGRLLQTLRDRKLYDRSLIIFTADHGETLDERPFVFDHGGRVYDEQIRVPLAIRFPSGRYGGRRIPGGVHQVDLLPTVLEHLAIPAPPTHGQSQLAAIRGEAAVIPRPLFSLARPAPARVPKLENRIIKEGVVTSIRFQDLKLISYPTASGEIYELFNLREDPGEQQNIAGAHPELVSELQPELARWRQAVGGDLLTPPPDISPDARATLRALGYVE